MGKELPLSSTSTVRPDLPPGQDDFAGGTDLPTADRQAAWGSLAAAGRLLAGRSDAVVLWGVDPSQIPRSVFPFCVRLDLDEVPVRERLV